MCDIAHIWMILRTDENFKWKNQFIYCAFVILWLLNDKFARIRNEQVNIEQIVGENNLPLNQVDLSKINLCIHPSKLMPNELYLCHGCLYCLEI